MAVSAAFRLYVLEQLTGFDQLTVRAMFGGYGLYSRGLLFGVLDDDVFYLRTDEAGRSAFESAGSRPFAPIPNAQPMLGYWEAPAEALEDRERLAAWSVTARDVAARSKTAKHAKDRVTAARKAARDAKPRKRRGRGRS